MMYIHLALYIFYIYILHVSIYVVYTSQKKEQSCLFIFLSGSLLRKLATSALTDVSGDKTLEVLSFPQNQLRFARALAQLCGLSRPENPERWSCLA